MKKISINYKKARREMKRKATPFINASCGLMQAYTEGIITHEEMINEINHLAKKLKTT